MGDNIDKVYYNLLNEDGNIRMWYVWDYYHVKEVLDEEDIVELYEKWRNQHEYIALQRIYTVTEDLYGIDESIQYDYVFLKTCKRGNNVHRYRIGKRLKPVMETGNIEYIMNIGDIQKCNVLFLTLTYNPARCNVRTAWNRISEEVHVFLTQIMKEFGKISYIRVVEATESFYPHVHMLVVFKEHSFMVRRHTSREGQIRYIISDNENKRIAKHWHSFVDIQAVEDSRMVSSYITKYLTKEMHNEKGSKTLAMLWIFRMQTYVMSRDLSGELNPLSLLNENGTNRADDLIGGDMRFCTLEYIFLAIIPYELLNIDPDRFYVEMKKPPPAAMECIDLKMRKSFNRVR